MNIVCNIKILKININKIFPNVFILEKKTGRSWRNGLLAYFSTRLFSKVMFACGYRYRCLQKMLTPYGTQC